MQILDFTENKLKFFTEHVWISLFLVCIGGLVLRLFYFPYNLPIILDGLYYFWFAYDVSMIGHLPTEYYIENDGWPIFLGSLLKFFHFENFLDYMTFQRIITCILSIVTALPIFLLCKKFFNAKYALVGAAIFIFEPRLVQNSLTGITEPLYLLLISSSLVLFFSSNKKFIFISFGFVALATIVRSEALFLFIVFSILYIIKFRVDRKMIAKYTIAILIFVLVLLPSVSYRIDNYGHDGILNKVIRSQSEIMSSANNVSSDWISFVTNGLINTIKFLGWDLIPIFIFFVPIGFILVVKEKKFQGLSVISIIIIMLGPALFAYLNNSDTRFLFVLYPLFCVLSIFTIKKFSNKFKMKNIILGIIIIGIFVGSIIFLEYKKTDYVLERDAFEIAGIVSQTTGGINSSTEISKYIKSAEINRKWPDLPNLSSDGSIPSDTKSISDESLTSVKDFIANSKIEGLTHLVIDEKTKNTGLKDVFYHSDKYPYLEIKYDSKEEGKKIWVKVFKINFEELTDS